MRLLETENSKKNNNGCKVGEESNGINSPQNFKDKSKKWQKFVTQVSDLSTVILSTDSFAVHIYFHICFLDLWLFN